jgi:hypothetical protein
VFVRNFAGTSSRIVTMIRAMELSIKDFRIGFSVGILARAADHSIFTSDQRGVG